MADDLLNAAQATLELEEIELEEIQEDVELTTGEFTRSTGQAQGAQTSSAGQISAPPPPPRASVPPPVPPEARERRSSAPPGGVPPVPLAAGATLPPPPGSGMYRIGVTPGAPAPRLPSVAELQAQLAARESELREMRSHNDRLRLTVRLREDRITELERTLRAERERVARLEAELELLRTADPPDDLKRIPGIGPAFERALHGAGITSFAQIAAWTDEDIQRIANALNTVPARIRRGRWVEHARGLLGGHAPAASESSEASCATDAGPTAVEPASSSDS